MQRELLMDKQYIFILISSDSEQHLVTPHTTQTHTAPCHIKPVVFTEQSTVQLNVPLNSKYEAVALPSSVLILLICILSADEDSFLHHL